MDKPWVYYYFISSLNVFWTEIKKTSRSLIMLLSYRLVFYDKNKKIKYINEYNKLGIIFNQI